jgi:hypothetical protein
MMDHMRTDLISRLTRFALAAGAAACAATGVSAASAAQQWDQTQLAVDRCQQELQYRIGREVGGRQPDVWLDERRMNVDRRSNAEMRVTGVGRYMRDRNDRGRDLSFDCTYISRNNSARAEYRWTGSGWDNGSNPGQGYDDNRPGYGNNRPGSGNRPGDYPPEGRVFFSGGIVSKVSRKCLDVEGMSTRNAANVQQWSCSGGANQLWDIIDLGRGEYSIVSQGSNKVLQVGNGAQNDGAKIEQFRWSGGDTQRWRIERAGGGAYRIVSVRSGKCLDLDGGRREDGANIQLWSCSGGANQAWELKK